MTRRAYIPGNTVVTMVGCVRMDVDEVHALYCVLVLGVLYSVVQGPGERGAIHTSKD